MVVAAGLGRPVSSIVLDTGYDGVVLLQIIPLEAAYACFGDAGP